MERVYLDKQIFSYLFKADNPVYQSFLADLIRHKDKFLYCYSHAHLLDLKHDKTEIKYKELEFIETLVDDNYLSYSAIEKQTFCYLVKPIDAFKSIEIQPDNLSLSNLFDNLDLSEATPKQREEILKAKDLLLYQKFDLGIPHVPNLPSDISQPLKKILPLGIDPMTMVEWAEHFMGTLVSMEEDKTIYKDLRNFVDKNLNNGRFTVDYDSIDFNDELKNSTLQKSFIEYVSNNLNPNGDKGITNYDFFTQAYFTLDLLGISKEPSKKVRFTNMMNDSYHSYYGAFCDYVISDDQGFIKKTKALYKLLGIQSTVYHIDEFISRFTLLTNSFETSSSSFFGLLNNDLKNGVILNKTNSIRSNRQITTIKPNCKYLGFFNNMDLLAQDNQDYILLTKSSKNYSNFSFYREYEGLVNKAIQLFGSDNQFKGNFNWDQEVKEIKERNWEGRFWNFTNMTILLEINKGINEIGLLITPKKGRY